MLSPPSRTLVLMITYAAVAVPFAGAADGARWQSAQAERALEVARFRDDRIVGDVSCLASDGTASRGATRFECAIQVWRRPPSVTRAQWGRLTGALRSGDKARVSRVIGLREGATPAERNAAVRRWGLDHPTREIFGLLVRSRSSWSLVPARLDLVTFDRSVRIASELRAAVPAIEAYGVDHDGYAGMNLVRLRQIDDGLSSRLQVVSADERGYCLQVSAGIVTWSLRGPGGTLATGRC